MKNKDASVEIWGDGKARREFMYAGGSGDAVRSLEITLPAAMMWVWA